MSGCGTSALIQGTPRRPKNCRALNVRAALRTRIALTSGGQKARGNAPHVTVENDTRPRAEGGPNRARPLIARIPGLCATPGRAVRRSFRGVGWLRYDCEVERRPRTHPLPR